LRKKIPRKIRPALGLKKQSITIASTNTELMRIAAGICFVLD
jgi:hypothetical protein